MDEKIFWPAFPVFDDEEESVCNNEPDDREHDAVDLLPEVLMV